MKIKKGDVRYVAVTVLTIKLKIWILNQYLVLTVIKQLLIWKWPIFLNV